jgi:hypothetical protein
MTLATILTDSVRAAATVALAIFNPYYIFPMRLSNSTSFLLA